eukprot:jgi/Tetstr1/429017/TSEL_018982.t1
MIDRILTYADSMLDPFFQYNTERAHEVVVTMMDLRLVGGKIFVDANAAKLGDQAHAHHDRHWYDQAVFIAKNVDVAAEIQDKLLQQYGVSTFNNDISGNLKISSFAEEAISIAVACNEGLLDCEGKALSDQLIPERELLKEWQETSNDTARFDI